MGAAKMHSSKFSSCTAVLVIQVQPERKEDCPKTVLEGLFRQCSDLNYLDSS